MSDLTERLRDDAITSDERSSAWEAYSCHNILIEAADRIETLEKENAEWRETNQKLHRRCQQAERVHAMTVRYLSNWLDFLANHANKRPRKDRLLFRWAIQDLHRKANSASRALPMDAKERKE